MQYIALLRQNQKIIWVNYSSINDWDNVSAIFVFSLGPTSHIDWTQFKNRFFTIF